MYIQVPNFHFLHCTYMYMYICILCVGNKSSVSALPKATPTQQPSTTVVYESLEDVVRETKSASASTSFTASKPPVPPKPSLPPKPTNLRHAKPESETQDSSQAPPPIPPPVSKATTDMPPPILPKGLPLPEQSQSDSYIYEIPGSDPPPQTTPREKTPPPVAPKPPKSPVHAIAPPPGSTRPRPSPSKAVQETVSSPVKQEPLYDLPPDSTKKPHLPDKPQIQPKPRPLSTINETIYDLPPDTVAKVPEKPRPLSVAEEVLYDLPPPPQDLNIVSSPDPVASTHSNVFTTDFENSFDDSYQNVAPSDPWKTTPSPDSTSDTFYGNVTTSQFMGGAGDVPTTPLPSIKYRAKYSFSATDEEEVSFTQGDIVSGCTDYQSAQDGWVRVRHDGGEGWAPLGYLQPIDDVPVSPPPPTSPPQTATNSKLITYMYMYMYSEKFAQPKTFANLHVHVYSVN